MKNKMESLKHLPDQENISLYMLESLPNVDSTGLVHSVFGTSFNILVKDQLYHFSSQNMPLSAHGCSLNHFLMKNFLGACNIGDLVRVNNKELIFYTKHNILKINIDQLNPVDLTIPVIDNLSEKISETKLYKELMSLSLEGKIGLEITDIIKQVLTVLKEPSHYSKNELQNAIELLIGRGQGLTPSGDDILMGYLMVKMTFGCNNSFESMVKNKVSREVTTEISYAYYEALFSGSVSSLFVQLILSLQLIEEGDVGEVINRISLYGHTSGYDTLFGFYLGLQSVINEMENDT